MTKISRQYTILVDLDSILDTRIATVAGIDETLALDVLNSNYHKREEDIFPNVDKVMFDNLYKNRDANTITRSAITAILPLMVEMKNIISSESKELPDYSGIGILINIFPYQLSDDLIYDIRLAVSRWLGNDVEVTAISCPDSELSPSYLLEQNVVCFIKYQYEDWINYHLESMQKDNLRHVRMYVPAIYFKKKPSEEEMRSLLTEAPHPFVTLEIVLKPAINFNLITIDYFSIFRPKDINKFDKIVSR